MKYLILVPIICILFSCNTSKVESDLIIMNATIYSVDSTFTVHEAMAIKDGKIIEIGSNELIHNNYTSKDILDLKGKFVYPGFIDAHCHFYGYGMGLGQVDLIGTRSYKEVLDRTFEFYKDHFTPNDLSVARTDSLKQEWLIGRGWDQNDWQSKEFPDRRALDSLFPNIPVILKRIDGHAALVNGSALELAKFNTSTKIKGGELIIQNGKLSGVLIDNAVDSVEKLIGNKNTAQIEKALLKAQENCLAFGITTVDDAGLEKKVIDVIDKLQKDDKLKMRVYAMLTPNKENLEHYLTNGIYKTELLNVRSFKFYGDGALGSRGACLCKAYADKEGWKGFLLSDISYFESNAKLMFEKGFQMNTHCIGDSAAKVILSIYNTYCNSTSDLRWRIEHAQVILPDNFKLFSKNILPSVQPTHATSDMYWAADRLGNERVKQAYAYKKLLQHAKVLPLGTDFPVEDIDPFKTFYAAVVRKDAKGFPEKGFQIENAISRVDALKGMTTWAAYSNFEEKEKGSLEKGKFADLVILDNDLLKCQETEILKSKVLYTIINGKIVYSQK